MRKALQIIRMYREEWQSGCVSKWLISQGSRNNMTFLSGIRGIFAPVTEL
jgi:hypothetical protein